MNGGHWLDILIAGLLSAMVTGCKPADGPVKPKKEPRADASESEAEPEQHEPAPDVRIEPTEASDALRGALEEAGLTEPARIDAPQAAVKYLDAVAPLLGDLHRDCEAGSALACWLWDDAHARSVVFVRRIGDEGREHLRPACDGGDLAVCAVVAQSLDEPSGVGGKPIDAVTGMMPACRAGMLGVCVRAANIRIGSGLKMDALSEEEARGFYEPACAKGFANGCHALYRELGAIPPEPFETTHLYEPLVRVCERGDESSCASLLSLLEPARPFGCDLCDPAAMQDNQWRLRDGSHEERCMHCWVTACRKQHCCDDCPGRNTYACCGQEAADTPLHPDHAAPLPRADGQRALEAARRGTARAGALFDAGCQRGHRSMCLTEALDEKLDALAQTIEQRSSPRSSVDVAPVAP